MAQQSPAVSEVICCAGPPVCALDFCRMDNAMANATLAGCPFCRHIIIHADGSESEYRVKAN